MLACYLYPFGTQEEMNIKEYYEKELSDEKVVEELFDFCQILEGYISESGWNYLIKHYGYEKLYEIDKRSGWLDADTLDEYIRLVEYEIEIVKDNNL